MTASQVPVVSDRAPSAQPGRDESGRIDLDTMVRSFPQGAVIIFDRDLRYLSAGGLALADVGLSRETLEGRTVFEVFSAAVVEIIEPLYRQALAGQESSIDVPYEGRIFLQRLGPLRDADDQIVGGMGFTQDVTQARMVEQHLRESEQRFRVAFDFGSVPMALIGLDGRYQQVNPAMCEFTGFTESDLLEFTDGQLTHPDDLAADLADVAGLLDGKAISCTADRRYLTGSGGTAWGTKFITLVRTDRGTPLHFIIQVQDITARKVHEQSLIEERQRRRDAEEIGQVGSWSLDLRTQSVYWSDGLFKLYGLDVDKFDGNYAAALECIDAEDRAVIDAGVQACAATGHPLRGRYRIVRATDKAVRWIETRGEAQYDQGVPVRICGAIADITDQVQADAAAADARSFQQAVLDASPDIISVYDLTRRSVQWTNRSIPEMLGYSQEELAATPPANRMVPVEDRPQLDAALTAAREAVDDQVIDVDYRMITKSGLTRWFSQRTAPLRRDRDGKVTQIVGVLHETTEAKAVQNALKDSEALFRQLAESVDVAFILRSWDPSSILYVNPTFEKIFGYHPSAAAGEHPNALHALVHPDDQDNFNTDYLRPAEVGRPAQAEYRIIRPDGEVRWLRSKTTPVPDLWGNRRSASITEDITVRRHAEAALHAVRDAERANTAKNEFLSRMSHELRTPLNAVLGFAQLLEMDDLHADQLRAVHHILRGGRHLVGLIDDVLDISKIENDRLDMSLELVPVSRLIAETVELMAPQAAAADIELRYQPSLADPRPVRADHRRLRQVVLNLLSNAIKYNRPGGRVDITHAVTAATHLDILVRDNGRGIRAEHLPRLFVPFDRLDAASSDIEGTGVGLALSYRLMTLMDGSLTAQSEFGVGSVFTASIPLATGSSADAIAAQTAPPDRNPVPDRIGRPTRKLLYVEDNSSNIELMERLINRRPQWAMIVAGHGALGLELATSNAPDLILLDLHLPDMDGIDVLRELRSDPRTADLSVVVISADASQGQIKRLLTTGANAYLTKPLIVAEVLALLDSVDAQTGSSNFGRAGVA